MNNNTLFEQMASEMGIEITVNENGFYTKKAEALAVIVNEVILSDDETIFNLPWEEQKEMIKEKFYSVFPYMAK